MSQQHRYDDTRSMPMISMHNVVVTGGNFTQHIEGAGENGSFDILKNAVAHTAFHNSAARFDPPKCHPNTRVAVLNKILSWVQRCDSETWDRLIMWLTGAAGAGKSAIAQSFVELCLQHNLVIASFFFGKSDSTRNHSGALIATIAYQIYHAIPPARRTILTIIDNDPLIFTRSLEHQFTELVMNPLDRAYSSGTAWPIGSFRVIVIDGLDECLDTLVQQQIIWIISAALRQYKLPILFFISSRPEHDISAAFGERRMNGVYTRVYLDDTYEPDEDIYVFLQDSFAEIRANHPFGSAIPASWPSFETLKTLVKKSSGQFIYAATIIRFIQSIRHHPPHQLDIVLKLRADQGDLPFAELDAVYRTILSTARDIKRVLYVLSVYALHVIKAIDFYNFGISEFMRLGPGELNILFCDLGALVSVEKAQNHRETLKILHASLLDFLLDPMRSGEFFIDIETYRSQHLANILHFMTLNFRDNHAWASTIAEFSRKNFPLCQSSIQLKERSAAFPLVEICTNHTGLATPKFIFYMWLPFLNRMACVDREWLSIQKNQEEALDTFFLSRMPSYYGDPYLMTLLSLVCHSGTDYLVPAYSSELNPSRIFNLYSHILLHNRVQNTLWLELINLEEKNTDRDRYRQCLIRFLQDPARSGIYMVGADTYAAVASFLIETISLRICLGLRDSSLREENMVSRKIIFHESSWTLKLFSGQDSERGFTKFVDCFLLLGYIIFFLPRSAKSTRLIQNCEQQNFLTPAARYFPERINLLRRSMQDYLERVKYNDAAQYHELTLFRGVKLSKQYMCSRCMSYK